MRAADLAPTGRVETLIGEGLFKFGDVDGAYPAARLQHCIGVGYHSGFVYVAGWENGISTLHQMTDGTTCRLAEISGSPTPDPQSTSLLSLSTFIEQ